MDERPTRRFTSDGSGPRIIVEDPAAICIAPEWPNADDRITMDRSIDMGKLLARSRRFISDRGGQPVRIDTEHQELDRVAIEAVGDTSHLVFVGTMDEALAV